MKKLVVVFSAVFNFTSAKSDEISDLTTPIWSPNRLIKAQICEINGKSGINFSAKKIHISEVPVSPSRPLIWSGDSSGVFIIEHIAHGNCIYFLKIGNYKVEKFNIDPNLDNLRSYEIIKVSTLNSITEISFKITLHGKKLVDRYNILYNLSYNHKLNIIKDHKIISASNKESVRLSKLLKVAR